MLGPVRATYRHRPSPRWLWRMLAVVAVLQVLLAVLHVLDGHVPWSSVALALVFALQAWSLRQPQVATVVHEGGLRVRPFPRWVAVPWADVERWSPRLTPGNDDRLWTKEDRYLTVTGLDDGGRAFVTERVTRAQSLQRCTDTPS